jgi:hypothetical protein
MRVANSHLTALAININIDAINRRIHRRLQVIT